MVIFKENDTVKTPVKEMARASVKGDGLPFDVQLYSNDHDPPHAHIVKKGKSTGKFLISKKLPKTYNDITPHNCKISSDDLKELWKWSSKKSKGYPGGTNWDAVSFLWYAIHADKV